MPARYDQVRMVLGEGNFVLVLSEGEFQGKPAAFYDLYHLEEDKIVEHWDVVEAIPPVAERKTRTANFEQRAFQNANFRSTII